MEKLKSFVRQNLKRILFVLFVCHEVRTERTMCMGVPVVTEAQIQEALTRLVKGRTTFALAHRLSTLKNANRLVVLEEGRIAETGTHKELMEHDGLYAGLVKAQRTMNAMNFNADEGGGRGPGGRRGHGGPPGGPPHR